MLIESSVPTASWLGPDPEPSPLHRAVVIARLTEEVFEPEAPLRVASVAEVADPDHEAASPSPLVAPSFRESLLPVAEHAGAV
jgi:hypothetical protein